MFSLPFKKLREIEQLGASLPLEGLILILTTSTAPGGLLVYLDDCLPHAVPLGWLAKQLSDLREDDVLQHDGLSVGFGALDLCLPLLPTHGPGFYPIRRLFSALEREDAYRDNAWRLAQALHRRVEFSKRRDRKIIELLFPAWLQQGAPDRSVALALRQDRISAYLSKEDAPRWLSAVDLDCADLPGDWVWMCSEPELTQAFPSLQKYDVTGWRALLRDNQAHTLLAQARSELARSLWQKAQCNEDPNLRHQAYALALERWLPERADEQLVAVLTPSDFEQLLETGDALFISRVPVVSTGDHRRLALDALLEQNWSGIERDRYQGPWFVLPALATRLRALNPLDVIPLELVWYRTGALVPLAISLQGLANDLFRSSPPTLRALQVPPLEAAALAVRGAFLIGFSNPWGAAWSGRYGVALDQAYRLLDDVLLIAEQEHDSKSIQIVRRWLGCYPEEQLPHRCQDLRDVARNAAVIVQETDLEGTTIGPWMVAAATDVVQAVRVLAGEPDDRQVSSPPMPIGDFQKALLSEQGAPIVSDYFWKALTDWSQNHRRLQTIEQSLALAPPSAGEVDDLLLAYRRLLRCLHALPHELTLLRHGCSQDVQRLERLRSALRHDVSLRVELLTPQVVLGERTRLSFQVVNIGGREATDVRIALEQTQTLHIDDDSIQRLPDLPGRGTPQRLAWWVTPQSTPLAASLRCDFFDGNRTRSEPWEFSLYAIKKPGPGQGPRGGNPFQAGVAVSGLGFFGRRKELKSICDLLLSGVSQPMLLRGPRRMGKTSILHQIEYLLTHEGELQRQLGYTREEEARLRRWRPVIVSLQEVHSGQDISRWYQQLFEKIVQVASVAAWAAPAEAFDRDPYFEFARRLKELMNAHPTFHLLILLDEWDVQRHLKEFGGKLRALMQSSEMKRVNWVFASTWMLSDEAGRFPSPFYAQTRPFELKEMAWSEAQTMLTALSDRAGVAWQGEALVTLLDQTARRPYLIQSLGQRIFEHLALPGALSNLVTMETVNAAITDFVHSSRGQGAPFTFLWDDGPQRHEEDQATLSWLGRLILLVMDPEHPLKSIEISQRLRESFAKHGWNLPDPSHFTDHLRENLSQLERIFDTLKVEGRHYAFSIPLAQAWFHHAVSQYDDPWQFAWEKLTEENRRQRRSAARRNV